MSESQSPLQVKLRGDTAFAKLRARLLDENSSKLVLDQLVQFSNDHQCRQFMLSFSGVEYVSSAFFGGLINLHKAFLGRGIRFLIVNVNPQTLEVFKITKLDRFFDISESDEDDSEFDDNDLDDGLAGQPSPLLPPKPSGGASGKLPFRPSDLN